MKLFFFILLTFVLQSKCFSQAEKSFNCEFLSQIFRYIKYEHKERIKALKRIGGSIEYSYNGKSIKYKNKSILPDNVFSEVVKKYDLLHLVDDPLVNESYKNNIIVDTLKFFPKNCTCLENNDSVNYQISYTWIINKDIPNDTQLIRLVNIYIEKGMLVIVLNSNRSPYYLGYFHFEIDEKMKPKLKKIKWLQPQYDIDNF